MESQWSKHERKELVSRIRAEALATSSYTGRPVFNRRVMSAFSRVPRHQFTLPSTAHLAYINAPLSIGHGQTISQPFIVVLMTDILDLSVSSKVLEIGTGSGYQTAILAELADEVYTVEIIPELQKKAKKLLLSLGYDNVKFRVADGHHGWQEHAPYTSIIVTAAATEIPEALIEQLAVGGRMIIPVGKTLSAQQLILVEKNLDGEMQIREILPVSFVPMQ